MSTVLFSLAQVLRWFILRGMRFAINRIYRLSAGLIALVALSLPSGCAPEIGDDCKTSDDCSVSGDRLCDRSVPGSGGYCTIAGCDQGTCPDEAICVEFRPAPERLSSTWCMASCDNNGDCRTGDGFSCVTATELGNGDADFARALDGADKQFCATVPST